MTQATSPDQLTKAEKLFERFCDAKGLGWRRIQTAWKEGRKRPDYAVWVGGRGCVVEVKQIDPNEEDRRQQEEVKERGWTRWKEEPGRRLRRKITEAADQLRPFAKRRVAGVLVLFDGTGSFDYLDSYNVMAGMYGLDALEIVLVHGRSPSWCPSRWKSGGKEKLTPTTNTSVSALAILHLNPKREPYLVVYHNDHATVRLDASCVARVTEHQFIREGRRPEGVNTWIHAITGETLV